MESLKLVIKTLKQTNDVIRYKYAVSVLQKIVPSDPDARLDEDWADRTSRKMMNEMEQMEAALKSYKHNLIKESIRVYLSHSILVVGKFVLIYSSARWAMKT